jgi:hypothetical protein
MYDFFIVYATPDRQQAQNLRWFLQDDACKVFLDVEELEPGASWGLALRAALEASRVIVVLVSTNADDAFYQQEEIVRAIQLARDKPNAHTVIPVILEKLPQGAVSMPYGMSNLHAQDATRPGSLKRVAAELVIWRKKHQLDAKQPKVADAAIEAEHTATGLLAELTANCTKTRALEIEEGVVTGSGTGPSRTRPQSVR